MSDTEITKTKSSKVTRWVTASLLVLVLTVIGCEVAGWPFLRQPLQQFLQNKLHRSVEIERPFHLQLLGGIRLQVGGLNISAPEGFGAPYFVDARGLDLQLRYRHLWSLKEGDPYRIQAIRADQLNAYLLRHADRHASWDFELDDTSPPRPFPVIEQLAVNQGQAKVDDAITHAQLAVKFFTEEGEHLASPESRVKVSGKFRRLPLQGELVTQGFLPVATHGKDSPPINSQGWLKYGAVKAQFRGSVYDLFGEQRVKGKVDVTGPSLADVGDLLDLTFPRTSAFKVAAEVEKGTSQWKVNIPSAKIGRSRLSGEFVYDLAPEIPMLSGKLQGALLMLADLAPAFGAAQDNATNTHPGKLFPDESLDFATYGRMNADIDVHLDAVDLGSAFRQKISPLKLHLTLNKHKLSLAELQANTAQGSVSGALSIDAHDSRNTDLSPPPAPDWEIQLAVRDIRLEQWLKVQQNQVQQNPPDKAQAGQQQNKQQSANAAPPYISGRLTGKAKLQGRGRSTAALLKSLDGQVALMIRQGEISHLVVEAAGLDIAQAVGVLIKGDQPLPMQCAAMGWRAKQGVLTPEAALIDTPVTTVNVLGQVNLGEEQLNLKLQANPKNFSPFTVRSPILVTGPFVNPQVSLSPGPIAARVAGGLLLALINPFAAIVPFLDPGSQADAAADDGCQQTLQQLKSRQSKSPQTKNTEGKQP
ncbi:AsmA family protein [Methylophilus methylotrophus]|uniref:AsmA family protein n=1 Tax=Methylophilus methylotrophus TaxID=17 RepID=UPI00037785DA|nr:AsmA family protein [Methylophilus methylotrophus]